MDNIEEREFKSFFKDLSEGNESRRCNYTTRLDTYGTGCHNSCRYCYARSLLEFRGMWHPNNPAIADIEEIRKTIRKELRPHEIVRLGGMTDCFQDAEKQHHVTLATIKELNKAGVGYLIVTKNKLVAEDEYIKAMDRSLAHIQVSITTTDSGISKRYEPGASLPEERIAAVERLQAEGFDVSVRLSPYIPQFVDIDRINAIRCDKILVEFLRVNHWIEKWMRDVDLRPYTLTKSGYKHLPLAVKKKLIARITGFKQVSVCEDVYGHWLYWKQNLNANPDDCCNLRVVYKENPILKRK